VKKYSRFQRGKSDKEGIEGKKGEQKKTQPRVTLKSGKQTAKHPTKKKGGTGATKNQNPQTKPPTRKSNNPNKPQKTKNREGGVLVYT